LTPELRIHWQEQQAAADAVGAAFAAAAPTAAQHLSRPCLVLGCS
jgi:hypothetical protein